jgi:hypothetical protein
MKGSPFQPVLGNQLGFAIHAQIFLFFHFFAWGHITPYIEPLGTQNNVHVTGRDAGGERRGEKKEWMHLGVGEGRKKDVV